MIRLEVLIQTWVWRFPTGTLSRWLRCVLLAVGVGVWLGVTAGCQRQSAAAPSGPDHPRGAALGPVVRVVKPQRKTIRHPIEQPGFNIEAFQETPLDSKIAAYVATWNVDIGVRVSKGQVLAELYVPEMEVELRQKEAGVRQATAQIAQARAAALNANALVKRSKSQYERLAKLGQGGALPKESIEELRLGYDAAKAGLDKANADVAAAEANREVATANRDYVKTMLQYTQIPAPYNGVVAQRKVNERDSVQPTATGAKGQPLFNVSQIDPVRVIVNVPGADAAWIKDGDPVDLRLQGAGGELFQGQITRNAHSLNPQARTLRTEIDLPNPQGKLLPGMDVQAPITVQHPNVWTLPPAAVLTEGDQTFCYRVEGDKAVRTLLQVGLRGGGLVEVLKKQVGRRRPRKRRRGKRSPATRTSWRATWAR